MFSATAPWEQDWTPAGKYGATCHCHLDKSRQDFFTVYLDGFSQAELVQISELASAAEVPSATAAVHAAWNNNRGIPKQLGKEVVKEDDIDVLGARVAATFGRILLPRAVASKLIVLSLWFCQEEPRTIVHAQIVGGRWVRAFQFRRELSSILANLGNGSARKNCVLAAGFSWSL